MSRSILILNDGFRGYRQHWELGAEWDPDSQSMSSGGVPPLDRLSDRDVVAVIDQIESADQAVELAGGLRLAVEGGLTAIVLYPVALEKTSARLVRTLAPQLSSIERVTVAEQVVAAHQAFYKFFRSYGRASSMFASIPSDASTLGTVEKRPVGISTSIGRGTLYVLPFHVASLSASYNPLVRSVLAAIQAYESGEGDLALPEFVDDMRLPGEADLLSRVDALRGEMVQVEENARTLKNYRQMIGRATGDALERLVISALNVVLSGTSHEAQDRPDVKAEDFWIVDSGQDRALAEVKGIGGSVNRQAVNQVDNHRAENDLSVDDIPGLLIVNMFRNSDDLEQRTLPVPADVLKHAVRLNVLVLRSRDLYFLLHQALGGKSVGNALIEALDSGGGWLEVTESMTRLHAE